MSKKINSAIEIIKEYEKIITPQANNMNKIVIAIKVMKHSPINESDLGTGFSMSKRQADYYSNALRFLRLINTYPYGKNTIISLNDEAMKWFQKGSVEKRLREWIRKEKLLEEYEQKLLSMHSDTDTTLKRREKSLEAWKRWMDE